MNKKVKTRSFSILILIFLLLALAGSVLDYAVGNERLVKESTYKTLLDAAQQLLTGLRTKLDDQFSQLEVMAHYASEQGAVLDQELVHAMNVYEEKYRYMGLGFVNAGSGQATLNSGETLDASQRYYFTNAMEGHRTIEYVEHGSLTGSSIIVLSVPVYYGGEVAAVIFAVYKTESFALLMEATAYEGQSYSYVTDADSKIIIVPDDPNALISEGSVLEFLERAQLPKGVTTESIAQHMKDGESISFSYSYGEESRYVSVVPTGIDQWSLFYVTMDSVVSRQEEASADIMLALMVKLTLIFIAIALVLWLRDMEERRALAFKEEEYRIAASHSEKIIMRYDIKEKTITYATGHAPASAVKRTLTSGVPEATVAAGLVAEDSREAYLSFYAAMRQGQRSGSRVLHMKANSDEFGWFQANYTLLEGDKTPRYAIISFFDITRQREQELVYEKWRRSIHGRAPESYSLFRCNIGKEITVATREGELLTADFEPGAFRFDSRTDQYVSQCVAPEDREAYTAFLKSESLLANYYRGDSIVALDYRELLPEGEFRWMRLTVELVPHVDSTDIEVYLLYEDINDAKLLELELLERAETDPLTGLLNRTAFTQRVNALIRNSALDARHAMLMLDIDNFKAVNDVFGHGAGDQTLRDIAELLSGALRRGDLVCRLGGDEFVVFLSDIPDADAAAGKARQICALARRSFSADVQISASIGIALCPQNGDSFETLYEKADESLYFVKRTGKNNYAFCSDMRFT